MHTIITDPVKGGNFLSWSIYYLSGTTEYYHVLSNSNIHLPKNPIKNKNAHNFKSNQACTLEMFHNIFNTLNIRDINSDSLYFHTLRKKNNGSISIRDTKHCINTINNNNIKTIILSSEDKLSALYHSIFDYRSEIYKLDSLSKISSNNEILDHYINYYFNNSKQKWNQLQLNEIWDIREFLALNINPLHEISINSIIRSHSFKYFYIDTKQLWLNFEYIIEDLFDYINVSIDYTRYDDWILIYNQWKTQHYNRITFMWYFEKIIEDILQGNNTDLSRFNLDIIREAAIQHVLLYDHGLNLKTYNLNQFNNTLQLHNRLEPNIHHKI